VAALEKNTSCLSTTNKKEVDHCFVTAITKEEEYCSVVALTKEKPCSVATTNMMEQIYTVVAKKEKERCTYIAAPIRRGPTTTLSFLRRTTTLSPLSSRRTGTGLQLLSII
jgi:hypothetical protein